MIANIAGWGDHTGIPNLIKRGRVKHIICSLPKGSQVFAESDRAGNIELELTPQGTLAERIRAARGP